MTTSDILEKLRLIENGWRGEWLQDAAREAGEEIKRLRIENGNFERRLWTARNEIQVLNERGRALAAALGEIERLKANEASNN